VKWRRQWQSKSVDESLAQRPRCPFSGQPRPVRTACGEKRASSPGECDMHALCVRNVRLRAFATPSTSHRADPSPPRNGFMQLRATGRSGGQQLQRSAGCPLRVGARCDLAGPPPEWVAAMHASTRCIVLSRKREVLHTASHVRKTVDECPEREATTAFGDLIRVITPARVGPMQLVHTFQSLYDTGSLIIFWTGNIYFLMACPL
jgi:hypothetical protein